MYYKYIDSKGEIAGYGINYLTVDEYGKPMQNIELTKKEYNLVKQKNEKIYQNDVLRDKALFGGVTYNNVLFDSDTDQKINLLAMTGAMSDTDTVVWYGMNNKGLLCTKYDLMAIGQLITELHSFCWNKNACIKEQIEEAQTTWDLNHIEIDYNRKEV